MAPYTSINLVFNPQDINGDSTSLNFNIEPIYHAYDSKNYNFNIYNNHILGDVNGDGGLNVLDVVILVNIILGNVEETVSSDVNQDGIINVLDVISLLNIILGE